MNGYEFIKRVKEIRADVKVFFMTAFEIDDIDFRRILPSVKIDEFIKKPISLEDLSGVLKKYITIEIKNRPEQTRHFAVSGIESELGK